MSQKSTIKVQKYAQEMMKIIVGEPLMVKVVGANEVAITAACHRPN